MNNSDVNNLRGAFRRRLQIEAPPAQVRDDENLAIQLLMQDRQAQEAEDLRIATFLNINGYMPPPQPPNPTPTAHQADDLAPVPTPNLHQISSAFPDQAGGHTENNLSARHACAVCQEQLSIQRIAKLPCGHSFCEGCIREHFQRSITDEQLFPPKCCGRPISLDLVRRWLSFNLLQEYEQREIELAHGDRTYCSNPRCSAFLQPDAGKQVACDSCGTQTCRRCKAQAHFGDCPVDPAMQQVLDLARHERWKRCHQCRALVAKEAGCNHMRVSSCKLDIMFVLIILVSVWCPVLLPVWNSLGNL